ncbi:MAG: hypothetical protein HY716_06635 [Planctomycetes bacterium]|nr:hypothetical protein [Planctomycetota bacterium]
MTQGSSLPGGGEENRPRIRPDISKVPRIARASFPMHRHAVTQSSHGTAHPRGGSYARTPRWLPWIPGAAGVVLGAVVITYWIAKGPETRPSEREKPPGAARPAAPAEDPAAVRRARLGAQWLKAQDALAALKENPSLEAEVRRLLMKIAEEGQGTEYAELARAHLEKIRHTSKASQLAEEQTLQSIRQSIDAGDLTEAATRLRRALAGPSGSEGYAASLHQLRTLLEERAPARYEALLEEARRMARQNRLAQARAHLLQATAWGSATVTLQAQRDAESLSAVQDADPAAGPPPK